MVKHPWTPCLVALALAACGHKQRPLVCIGPETTRSIAEALGDAYAREVDGVQVIVEPGGSGRALKRLTEGRADLALSRRSMHRRELDRANTHGVIAQQHLVAYEGFAVHVHPENDIRALSLTELRRIVGGDQPLTRWSDLGIDLGPGQDLIQVIVQISDPSAQSLLTLLHAEERPGALGVRSVDSSTAVLAHCTEHRNAIGFTGLVFEPHTTRTLPVLGQGGDPITPSLSTFSDGSYSLCQPLYICARDGTEEPSSDYLSWIESAAGRQILIDHGLVPARP